MAEHVRTLIRRRAKALLVDAHAQVGGNVFVGRARPLTAAQLPAIDLSTGAGFNPGLDARAGRILPGTIGDFLERHVALSVIVSVRYLEDDDNFEDAIDAIFVEVEKKLAGDTTLGGLVKDVIPITEPAVELSTEGDRPVARAEMKYAVEYWTQRSAPDVAS